ncbi:hypothetical protein BDN71DRAFT_999542 [Pleurotus eryngii]|uniref:BTB domain-containing protein n=1 Tax=Pleurotus eryngii TaxID=5323 RepID=A0A9P6D654_PLEER|nr:hypothetical protein BDN71DRAFT_999542 [Pleurotus eryngii]
MVRPSFVVHVLLPLPRHYLCRIVPYFRKPFRRKPIPHRKCMERHLDGCAKLKHPNVLQPPTSPCFEQTHTKFRSLPTSWRTTRFNCGEPINRAIHELSLPSTRLSSLQFLIPKTMSTDAQVKQETTTIVLKALEPFDDEHADVILRSCDGTDFYVYKCILSLASPFFRAMFSLPDSPNTNLREGNKAVVDMHEDSAVLDPLLRFCYPTNPPKISDKKIFYDVLSAVEKFEMQLGERVIASCINEIRVREFPLECFSLANRFALRKLAKDSARRCLTMSLDKLVDLALDTDLTHLPTKVYNRLLHYCKGCREACRRLVNGNNLLWLPKLVTDGHSSKHGKQWSLDHIKRISNEFTANGPGPLSVVMAIDFSEAGKEAATYCDTCRLAAIKDLQNFSVALERQINIEIDKIELELEF